VTGHPAPSSHITSRQFVYTWQTILHPRDKPFCISVTSYPAPSRYTSLYIRDKPSCTFGSHQNVYPWQAILNFRVTHVSARKQSYGVHPGYFLNDFTSCPEGSLTGVAEIYVHIWRTEMPLKDKRQSQS
jgi:hypothetical protein